MALQLSRMFSGGIRRVFTRTGGILFVGLLATQLLIQTSINTAVLSVFPPEAASDVENMVGLTLPVSGTVAGGLFAVAFVLSGGYFVVLSRALARPIEELSTFPSTLYMRRIGRATLSILVGGVIVGISVMVGFMLLFVPGVFLAICFMFFIFAVGVEDRDIISGLRRSWDLSRGHRIPLAVIVILAGIAGGIIGAVGAIVELAGSPIAAELASNTIGSVLFLFLYGLMAEAYLQVRDEEANGFNRSGTMDSEASTSAL